MYYLYKSLFGENTVEHTLVNIGYVAVVRNDKVEKFLFNIHLTPAFKVNEQYAVVCVGAVAVKVKLGFVAVTSAVINSRHNLVTEVCFPKFI